MSNPFDKSASEIFGPILKSIYPADTTYERPPDILEDSEDVDKLVEQHTGAPCSRCQE
jgi:hypothetical protein